MGFGSLRVIPEEIEIKGVAVRSLLEVLRERFGEGIVDELKGVMAEEDARHLDAPVLASTWYPIRFYRALHNAAQRQLSRGPELARSLAQEAVGRDFKGVYRLVAGTLKPEWLLAWAPRQYRRYLRGGVVTLPEIRAGYARMEMRECHGFDRSVWMDIMGSGEAILTACGATHLRARIKEGGEGDEAVLEFFWV